MNRARIYQWISLILPPVLLLGTAIYLALIWKDLPAKIPTNFDFTGEPNGWSGKASLWVLLGVGFFVYLSLAVAAFFPQSWSTGVRVTEANRERDAAHTAAIRDRLIAALAEIPHSALNGDAARRLPGNVNFCFEGIEGESLLLLLDDRGISASSGSACTSGSLDPSHVLLAIGRPHDVAHGSLRLSLGADVTEEEADYIARSVAEVVAYLRSFSPVWRDLTAGKTPFLL